MGSHLYVSHGIKWHRSAQFKLCCGQYNIKLCEWPDYGHDCNAIGLV